MTLLLAYTDGSGLMCETVQSKQDAMRIVESYLHPGQILSTDEGTNGAEIDYLTTDDYGVPQLRAQLRN